MPIGSLHLLGDEMESGLQAMSGPQGAGDQLQRVGQLLGEFAEPACLAAI